MIEEIYEGFEICLADEPEYYSPSEGIDFENEEQEQKYLQRFDDGELMWFCAKVSAWKNGIELASDYLGGCAYTSLYDFKNSSGYYEDMRETVVKEAREAIAGLTEKENLPEPNPKDFSISISWNVEDVQIIAGEEEKELTTKQCIEVLKEIERSYDAEYGITWDCIRTEIHMVK